MYMEAQCLNSNQKEKQEQRNIDYYLYQGKDWDGNYVCFLKKGY